MDNSSPDWQVQLSTFDSRAQHILDNGIGSDCSFIFESNNPQTIKAHKVFLIMISPVFERMFCGPLAESSPVQIKDCKPEDFRLFLQYVYTGSIVLNSFEDAENVYHIANKYLMPRLVELCIDRIWEFLSPKTACYAYEFARRIEDKELQDQCLKIISLDTSDVLQDPSFESIHVTTLETILDMDTLNISSEIELFSALCKWARCEQSRKAEKGECVDVRSVLKTTLPKIRFLTLNAQQIADGTVDTDLLTRDEILSILMNIATKDSKIAMPSGFSKSTLLRNGKKKFVPAAQNLCEKTFGEAFSFGEAISFGGVKPKELHGTGIQVLPACDRYSWFRNVKVTPISSTEHYSATYIHFEVAKKVQILGIQMHPPNNSSSSFSHNSSVNRDFFVCIELSTHDGEISYTSHFYKLMTHCSRIKINGEVFLKRRKCYVLKVLVRTSYSLAQAGHFLNRGSTNIGISSNSSGSESVQFKDETFKNANLIEFSNSHIKSIAFI